MKKFLGLYLSRGASKIEHRANTWIVGMRFIIIVILPLVYLFWAQPNLAQSPTNNLSLDGIYDLSLVSDPYAWGIKKYKVFNRKGKFMWYFGQDLSKNDWTYRERYLATDSGGRLLFTVLPTDPWDSKLPRDLHYLGINPSGQIIINIFYRDREGQWVAVDSQNGNVIFRITYYSRDYSRPSRLLP
ncbi:hypothetical protein [Anthocerotibacter panamensis]|uniref:hypothetical protein n=1 Tax=Anthocerotibacter panamensis TaxID=2857077 RepID=UPI001C404D6A|nr:hypothetical protein [Anthocerotibacter panamensis]